jgi:hypothetical protein
VDGADGQYGMQASSRSAAGTARSPAAARPPSQRELRQAPCRACRAAGRLAGEQPRCKRNQNQQALERRCQCRPQQHTHHLPCAVVPPCAAVPDQCCAACVCVCVRRAGELSAEELESVMTIVANPRAYKIPDWFLNRQKDIKDGRYSQVRATQHPSLPACQSCLPACLPELPG